MTDRTVRDAVEEVKRRCPFPPQKLAVHMSGGANTTVPETVRRYLPGGARILDFGAGMGTKAAVLQLLGYECTACDDFGDYGVAEHAESILAFARSLEIDYRQLDGGRLPFALGSFDMVLLNDVLEHLHDSPRALLVELLQLLRPEGYLFVTVPNAASLRKRLYLLAGRTNLASFAQYFWYPGHWRGHVREYVKDDLERLARYLNLDIVELRSYHHMLHRLPTAFRPPYKALTMLLDGSRDSWLLLARKRPGWSAATLTVKAARPAMWE